MIRLSFEEGFGIENLWRFRLQLLFGMFFFALVPIVLLKTVIPIMLTVWANLCILIFVTYWLKKRSIRLAMAAIIHNVLIGIDIVKGLFIPIPARKTYPTTVKIIDSSTIHDKRAK
jgi:hypothetical protein